MTDHDPTDDQLLDELRAALHDADGVPDAVLDAAKASFTWRTIDAELAELLFDSAVDELAGVRSTGGERRLTFSAGDTEIEIMIHGTGDARRLTGQIVPPQVATVELRSESDTMATAADELGMFSFDTLPSGPISLRFSTDDTAITTGWHVL